MLKKDFDIIKELNPDIIFEFGAFDGTDTLSYRRSFPEATIYSFEPDPILYASLRSQMRLNCIHFYNYAISDVTGHADFYYALPQKGNKESFPAGSLLPYTKTMKRTQGGRWEFQEAPIKVDVITIKDFCREEKIDHIDFMHMDVEGAVHKVVAGLGDLRPTLVLAEVGGRDMLFQGASSHETNNKLFANMGYEPIGGRGADTLYQLKTE